MNIFYDCMFGYIKIIAIIKITKIYQFLESLSSVKTKHNKKKTWFKGCHDI